MRQLRSTLKRVPFLRAANLFRLRLGLAWAHLAGVSGAMLAWLVNSREISNYTYELTPRNKRYLAAQIADVTGQSYDQIMNYVVELDSDQQLLAHIKQRVHDAANQGSADPNLPYGELPYGRRLGWYALVRAAKPKVVVETGVDKGLGSCVLTAAIARNAAEGCPGHYYGLDINPKAGYFFDGPYRQYGEILYGDAIATLKSLKRPIDLYVNDSDHTSAYEAREYQTIAAMLSPQAIVLGDNSHATDELLDFALATGRQFTFFKEQPANHWYPGAGIGIAFRRQRAAGG